MAVGDVVEIEGIARLVGAVSFDCVTFGETSHVLESVFAFELETPEGRIAVVPPASLDGCIVPLAKGSGLWSEFATSRLANLARLAPPPDVRIAVESATIVDGEIVRVRGRVREVGPAAGGDYRAAPEPRVTAIDAAIIGVGNDRVTAIASVVKAALPPRPVDVDRVWSGVMFAVRLATMIPLARMILRSVNQTPSSVLTTVVHTRYMWLAAIAWAMLGVGIWSARRQVHVRWKGTDVPRIRLVGLKIAGFAIPLMMGFGGTVAIFGISPSRRSTLGDGRLGAVLLAIPLFVLVGLAIPLLLERRRLRRLLQPAAGWEVLEGTCTGVDGADTFRLTHTRGTVVVATPHAVLASDVTEERGTTQRSGNDISPTVQVGGHVIVAGRTLWTGTRIAAASPGSVVIWATRPGVEPRRALDRAITREVSLVVQLGLGAIAALVVALVV